jgi:hypothetical protein
MAIPLLAIPRSSGPLTKRILPLQSNRHMALHSCLDLVILWRPAPGDLELRSLHAIREQQ